MPTALISTYDKTGVVDFARELSSLGYSIIASGGTAKLLQNNDIMVTQVSDFTGSPEILNGRVKTLHPAVHGGILGRATDDDRSELESLGWGYIDLVVVNLYPFTETIRQAGTTFDMAIEQIDIGGVALIRAAAKNHERVVLACDPLDYPNILEKLKNGGLSKEAKKKLAIKGFALTSKYDMEISAYLANQTTFEIAGYCERELRYGENPHQKAELFTDHPHMGPLGGNQIQGKEISYNNLLDLDAAWRAAVSFEKPTICIVKHLSPCGIASNANLAQAFQAALACDPVSAFGSVISSNVSFDEETALALGKLFVECIIAPGFSNPALEILSKRNNCRLITMPDLKLSPSYEIRSINHGFLKQEIDSGDPDNAEWKVVSKRQPTQEEWLGLRFAWKSCQYIKSNAIVFAKGEATVGIGGGQPNRVDCVKIAAERAGENSMGAVMASDAFFPFPDSIHLAHHAGITAVIQPGGSIRDDLSIEAADQAGMAMVLTGVRHFRH